MIRRILVLVLLMGGAYLLEPLRVPTEGVIAPKSLLLFGILLLVADTLGALAHDLKFPRIVGYVVAGAALGPSITGIVPFDVLEDMGMMKNLALGLIGLLAGAELRVDDLRQRWRAVVSILTLQVLFVGLALLPAMALLRPVLPFGNLPWLPFIAVAGLLAVMMMANSPMVVLALLAEGHSRGPLAKTTLSVVLVADVVVIFLFTVALSGASSALELGAAGGASGAINHFDGAGIFFGLMKEIGGSLLAGGLIGAIMALYVRYVKRELVLFAVVVVFATAAAADTLHFELLLSLLVAGFLFENVAPVRAEPMLKALEYASTPVFVVFFALTAAELRLGSFAALWLPVLVLVLVRGGAVWGANRLGSRLGGAEPVVERYGWTGLIPQAGVSLGFAAIVAREFPAIGATLMALTVGVVTVNTTVGPILFRLALGRAGELED
jgi:Kef-type K+ transport system membrane component KefB